MSTIKDTAPADVSEKPSASSSRRLLVLIPLLAFLATRTPSPAPGPRFDVVHLLWYMGALVVILQAGVIAPVLIANRSAPFQTASLSTDEPITRDIGPLDADRSRQRPAPRWPSTAAAACRASRAAPTCSKHWVSISI